MGSRITDIALIYQVERPVLSIRARVKAEELPVLISRSFSALGRHLEKLEEMVTEIPFVAYYNADMHNLDVEVCFPVARVLPGTDEIHSGVLAAGKRVFCLYRGTYGKITPVYEEMLDWIQSRGLKPSGVSYEHYYNGLDFPEEEHVTRLVMPVS